MAGLRLKGFIGLGPQGAEDSFKGSFKMGPYGGCYKGYYKDVKKGPKQFLGFLILAIV